MAHRLTADDVAQIYDVAPPRPLLVSTPAPLNRTRAELRAVKLAAMREALMREVEDRTKAIAEVEAWPAPRTSQAERRREILANPPAWLIELGEAALADRYEVTPAGHEALSVPDSTGSC